MSKVGFQGVNTLPSNFVRGYKKVAFTLAEVLITLAIIGVVAALTIPTLINKYQEHVLKIQFKKVYSMLSQVWLKAEYDFGYPPKCFYWMENPYGGAVCLEKTADGRSCLPGKFVLISTGEPLPDDYNGQSSECISFGNEIGKNLKIAKICQTKPFENGCVPEYEGQDTYLASKNPDKTEAEISAMIFGGAAAARKDPMMNTNYTTVLSDGTIIVNLSGSKNGISSMLFAVDINGKKAPNKWGYDLFLFQTVKTPAGNLKIEGYSSFKEDGGKTTKEMIKEISSK